MLTRIPFRIRRRTTTLDPDDRAGLMADLGRRIGAAWVLGSEGARALWRSGG